MIASSSEDVGAPGETSPFSLEPIIFELEGGRYVGPFLPVPLVELASGICGDNGDRSIGGGGAIGGGNRGGGNGYRSSEGGSGGGGHRIRGGGAGWGDASSRSGGAENTVRVRVRYDAHLPALSLWDEENLLTIMVRTVLPTF